MNKFPHDDKASRKEAQQSLTFAPWPYFAEDEVGAVEKVMRSGHVNYWTGEEGRSFEREFAQCVETRYAVAVSNGTVALELALYALGIGPGDDVVTTSRSYIASATCVVLRGARPVFADVDRESQNVTVETIAAALTANTRAIILVHLAGWPCEMDPILDLARQKNLFVIEDCAQAHGAMYKGKPVGSFGHINAFSFCQDKIMTTLGEGGMVTTDDADLWRRAWEYKDHGKSYDSVYNHRHAAGFRWHHESFGTNWRLTEVQSAVGRLQLQKLGAWTAKRWANAAALSDCFRNISGLRVTVPPSHVKHSYYKYNVFLRPEMLRIGWNRDRIIQAIVDQGIPCTVGGCGEVYLEQAFPNALRPKERLQVAKELGETSMMFLVHPTLTVDDMCRTCEAVRRVFH